MGYYFFHVITTLFFACLFCISSFGQVIQNDTLNNLYQKRALSQFQINTWSSDQGLPTQGVNGILQHDDGHLLISTYEGLYKFDGLYFKNIPPKNKSNNFIINSFKKIHKSPNGTIWIAANGGGIASIEDNEWKFYTRQNGIPSNVVNCFTNAKDNTLWVGTSDGAAIKNGDTFSQTLVDERLKSVTVNDILTDFNGNLWFATSQGLIKTDSMGHFIKKFTIEEGLGSNNVFTLCNASNNDIWIGTEKGLRLLKIEVGSDNKADESILLLGVAETLHDKSIYKIFQDTLNNVWIGTNRGLYRYNDHNIRIESIVGNSDLPLHQVTDIAQDDQGNIWVSTYRNGFYQLSQGKFITYSESQGISGKTIYSIIEIARDSFLIATNNGVTQYNEEWNFSPLKIENKLFLKNHDVRDIQKDRIGNIWFATTDKLYLVNNANEIVTFSKEDGLLSNYVRVLFEDSRGNIWIGTDEGLNKYSEGSMESFTKKDGLSNNRIHAIFEDSNGIIWISTEDGLNKRINGNFEKFYIDAGLAGNVIFKIYEDKDGVLWIGTNGGISRLKDNKFTSINKKNNLAINSVFDILEDDKGYFWIPNNQGIYRIAKEQLNEIADGYNSELNAIMYKKSDGMLVNACTAHARSLKTSKGQYWIPTPEGITVIPNPDNPETNEIPPKIVIDLIRFGDDTLSLTESITLPPEDKQLTINYTGLDYQAPERVSFSYSLGEFVTMETPDQNKREAVFTNIPPGKYTFNIIAFNSDNANSSFSFKIIKKAKFYETTWFLLLISVLGLILIWAIGWYFVSNEKRKNKVLGEKVKERTLEIEEQKKFIEKKKQEVEQKNIELEYANEKLIRINKEKNQLIGIVAHDLKSPLNQISGLIDIIKLTPENLKEDQKEYFNLIMKSTKRLNEMITHILDVEAVDSGKLKINLSDIELFSTMEQIINHYHADIERKKLELVFDHNGSKFPIKADEKIVIQIFDNLISNAIKFTPIDKNIFISIKDTSGENVRIEVRDQGPGISSADMHKLFGKYQKLSAQPTGGESSTGLGLSIVKKYVEALGGKVWCESKVGEGANFIVELKKISNEKYKVEEDYLLDS